MSQTKILLEESEIPTHWYNVVADMPNPPVPPLGPDGQPIGPDALAAIFPNAIVEQEVSAERWIEIPEAVREIYRLWRPSPDPAVTCIIPATSKVHHMQDNMMAGYGRLPDEKMRN